MDTTPTAARNAGALEANRSFYEPMWRDATLVEPWRFNTWPLAAALADAAASRLEVAPGLRPRLPVEGTHFVDLSAAAAAKLRARGALAIQGSITSLPLPGARYDLVAAVDIVEHVADDDKAFAELARVCAPGGALLVAVPLHPSRWTPFDDFVGHCRRYKPDGLVALLQRHGFTVESSAAYGMQSRSSRLLDFGMYWLTHHRERAMRLYNRIIMPFGLRLQKKLELRAGMLDATRVDEVLLVCRKASTA
ncbi:MAG TPA: methyltransferase domain-containing protein [Burkholderiales bacterium]|nr:methyltransferase domain-containing protein [Burkholderiales bacterium]